MNTDAMAVYQIKQAYSCVEGASAHGLITLLLQGAVERIAKAKINRHTRRALEATRSGDLYVVTDPEKKRSQLLRDWFAEPAHPATT